MNKSKSFLILILLVFVISIASILLLAEFQQRQKTIEKENAPPNINPVAVSILQPQTWQPVLETTGIISANQGTALSIQSSGQIKSIFVKSGQKVSKGTVILELDNTLEQAQLESYQAQYNGAKNTFERYAKLIASNSISRELYEQAKTAMDNLAATLKSAQATIERRKIIAPFDGELGIIQLKEGQYVTAGTEIVHLENLEKRKIVFPISQDEISKIKLGQKITAYVESFDDKAFDAKISAIDPAINSVTGLINVEAIFEPTQARLLSGMYAKVNVLLDLLPNQLVVPQVAISYALSGDSVFVVHDLATDDKHKDQFKNPTYQVTQINITTLDRRGVNALVQSKNLKIGDRLVVSGMQRLKNKSYVIIDEKQPIIGTTAPTVIPKY